MHNLRRKLTFLMLVLFVLAFFFPKSNTGSDNQTSAASSDGAYDTSGNTVNDELKSNTASSTILSDKEERYVAHRGYSTAAPENTLTAFKLAGISAFWGIETDIQQTADGYFVCFHDDTLDGITDGHGAIAEYNFAPLEELTFTSGSNLDMYPNERIPTMDEYLKTCIEYNCVPIIEIKKLTDYDGFLQVIYDNGLENKCIVTGQIEDLLEIRNRNADIFLMVVGYSNIEPQKYLELLSTLSAPKGMLYNYPVVTEDIVAEFKAQGNYFGVWTLETTEEAEPYFQYGADYVVTNTIPGRDNLMINTTE